MDLTFESQMMQNWYCRKFGALYRKGFLDKCVNWKNIKDQLKVIELIFIISEYRSRISSKVEVCIRKDKFTIEIILLSPLLNRIHELKLCRFAKCNS
jgi:hypothetical protein